MQTDCRQWALRRRRDTSVNIHNNHRRVVCGGHARAAFFRGSVN